MNLFATFISPSYKSPLPNHHAMIRMPPTQKEGTMATSPLAGKRAPKELLIDVADLERQYYDRNPDTADKRQLVSFGTSGHRGTSLDSTFTDAHIAAITQAI